MKLQEGIKILQEKYQKHIILVKNGLFYNAIGEDAIALSKEFGLVKICFAKEICKIGINENKISLSLFRCSLVIVKTKQEAKDALEKIKIFLKENLELELNKKTQIFKSKQGVNFCGYKINEYRMKNT